MKGHLGRTKVVLRHLPPTISLSSLMEHVDSRFSGRYHWLGLRPGKANQKHMTYSRAYIDFDNPDDVIEFAELFKGHVFVNEKGIQYKVIVEYAPSQRIPKQLSKNDGREGTILKDPEYLEFIEYLAKPTENLPSAEIQLERKEAERYSAPKDIPIVTPLMEYVRQKRAAKGGSRRTILNGKPTRGVSGLSSRSRVSGSSRRGLEKRDSTVVSGGSPLQQNGTINMKNSRTLNPLKRNKQREGTRRIRSTQLDEDTLTGSQLEQRIQASIQDRDRKPPRPSSARSFQKNINGALEVKVAVHIEKQESRKRNKDRSDRGVWAPPRRSDGSHASDELLSSNTSQITTQVVDSVEGYYKHEGRRGSAYNIKEIDGSPVAERKFSKRGGSSGCGSHEKQVWIQKSIPGP